MVKCACGSPSGTINSRVKEGERKKRVEERVKKRQERKMRTKKTRERKKERKKETRAREREGKKVEVQGMVGKKARGGVFIFGIRIIYLGPGNEVALLKYSYILRLPLGYGRVRGYSAYQPCNAKHV